MRAVSEELLIETFAEVIHDIWMSWATELQNSEQLSEKCKERWKSLFVPYFELPEVAKSVYRQLAKKHLTALKKLGVL